MKSIVLIPLLPFILFMLFCQCAAAQDYVLTTSGDSLTGQVKAMHYGPEKRVQIVSDEKNKRTLSIFEVREFSSDGEIFHPVRAEKGYVFMKLLQPGYLSLYAYQLESQSRFDGLLLKKSDGANLIVPNLGFKKYMGQFLEDCPDVVARIRERDLSKKNLSEIIGAYNDCITNRTVNHDVVLSEREQQDQKIGAWDALEGKIKEKEFPEKNNALEMVAEIKKKIDRKEAIPNFLTEALRNSLKDTGLSADLDQAMGQIN